MVAPWNGKGEQLIGQSTCRSVRTKLETAHGLRYAPFFIHLTVSGFKLTLVLTKFPKWLWMLLNFVIHRFFSLHLQHFVGFHSSGQIETVSSRSGVWLLSFNPECSNHVSSFQLAIKSPNYQVVTLAVYWSANMWNTIKSINECEVLICAVLWTSTM